jgi:hypothetical protein
MTTVLVVLSNGGEVQKTFAYVGIPAEYLEGLSDGIRLASGREILDYTIRIEVKK